MMDVWRYSIRWTNPYTQPAGALVLGERDVTPGTPCPADLLALTTPGDGYGVTLCFYNVTPPKTWTPERKARQRRRNLDKRLERDAPLFADQLREKELTLRSDYFKGK